MANGTLIDTELFIIQKFYNHKDIINEIMTDHNEKCIILYLNIN